MYRIVATSGAVQGIAFALHTDPVGTLGACGPGLGIAGLRGGGGVEVDVAAGSLRCDASAPHVAIDNTEACVAPDGKTYPTHAGVPGNLTAIDDAWHRLTLVLNSATRVAAAAVDGVNMTSFAGL